MHLPCTTHRLTCTCRGILSPEFTFALHAGADDDSSLTKDKIVQPVCGGTGFFSSGPSLCFIVLGHGPRLRSAALPRLRVTITQVFQVPNSSRPGPCAPRMRRLLTTMCHPGPNAAVTNQGTLGYLSRATTA